MRFHQVLTLWTCFPCGFVHVHNVKTLFELVLGILGRQFRTLFEIIALMRIQISPNISNLAPFLCETLFDDDKWLPNKSPLTGLNLKIDKYKLVDYSFHMYHIPDSSIGQNKPWFGLSVWHPPPPNNTL